jgi:hypothetical protein
VIIFVLVVAAAAGFLAWFLLERPRIQYGALKAPRALASALASITPRGDERTATTSEEKPAYRVRRDASSQRRNDARQQDEDVETMVRRHLYGGHGSAGSGPRSG